MSYCLHDVNCPGHGPDHDAAMYPFRQRVDTDGPMSRKRLKRALRTSRRNWRTATGLKREQ